MRRDTCRTCDDDVIWAVTTNGRNMPVDAEPVANGNVILIEKDGKTVAQVLGAIDTVPEGTPRYTSHFATCGQADVWRNR